MLFVGSIKKQNFKSTQVQLKFNNNESLVTIFFLTLNKIMKTTFLYVGEHQLEGEDFNI